MKPDKKKDGLTDLVAEASNTEETQQNTDLKEDQAVTQSGEVVTLGFEKKIDEASRDIVDLIKKKK